MENPTDIDKIINLLAQSKMNEGSEGEWFINLPTESKQSVLYRLAYLALQAGANDQDAINSVAVSGLKPTYTPCVLLASGNIKMQLSKVANLPESEWLKSYKLMIHLLSIADERRRNTDCLNGCSHWWHQL